MQRSDPKGVSPWRRVVSEGGYTQISLKRTGVFAGPGEEVAAVDTAHPDAAAANVWKECCRALEDHASGRCGHNVCTAFSFAVAS
jgi:hypothetical protein